MVSFIEQLLCASRGGGARGRGRLEREFSSREGWTKSAPRRCGSWDARTARPPSPPAQPRRCPNSAGTLMSESETERKSEVPASPRDEALFHCTEPSGSDGKESACNVGDCFHPWVGKNPWKREWQPTPVFLPGEVCGQRSLAGDSPWGH